MQNPLKKQVNRDPRITYRGENPGRLENLTDAVFGIAITLLIFNQFTFSTFHDLIEFSKTFPAFLISIGFIYLIWMEHSRFSVIYQLELGWVQMLNILFLALIIFYVYPLKYLTNFLSYVFFGANLNISIAYTDVPLLMMYYGGLAFLVYFCLFLFYFVAKKKSHQLQLSDYEYFFTRQQSYRLLIMFSVPLFSIVVAFIFYKLESVLGGFFSGITYFLYTPLMINWQRQFNKKDQAFPKP